MRFYKATRTNGTDFRTGRVPYRVGATVRPLPHNGPARLCGPGMLHAATVPTETLIGGWWPCRLFEVAGEPVAGLNDDDPYKAGFAELAVVRELDAHLALGPQGREVAALIDRTRRLIGDEIEALVAAWDAAWGGAQDAWDAASDAARDVAWDAARAAASDVAWCCTRAAALDAAWAAAWGGAWDAALEVVSDVASDAARVAAWDAAWAAAQGALDAASDAACALVVRDLLPAEQFDRLYGPWRDVIGPEAPGEATGDRDLAGRAA